jgi:hypothetical protein
MMEDHSPYSLVTAAPMAPGTDWVTKSPDGPLIDTGVDIKFNERGRLYLSVETIREMARIAGLFAEKPDDQAAALAEQHEIGRKAGIEENLNGRLGTIVDQLVSVASLLRNSDVHVEGVPEDVDIPESSAGVADDSPEPDHGPSRKRGRNDVPTATGHGSLRV